MCDTIEKTVVVNNVRLRVVREEGAEHPWESSEQICHLICWGDDADISFGADEDVVKDRPDNLKSIDSPEALQEWIKAQSILIGRSRTKISNVFYVLYIVADKYAFMDSQESIDGAYGALIITEEMFLEHCDGKGITSKEAMVAKMKGIALQEFKELQAWYGGAVFGYIIEQDNIDHKPFESSIERLDALWGFYWLGNTKEMYKEMSESILDGSDIRQAIVNKLLAT